MSKQDKLKEFNASKEELWGQTSKYDKKNKKNRKSNFDIELKQLEIINNGVTSEKLQKLEKEGYPIFYYRTQITIHGIFNDVDHELDYKFVEFMMKENNAKK